MYTKINGMKFRPTYVWKETDNPRVKRGRTVWVPVRDTHFVSNGLLRRRERLLGLTDPEGPYSVWSENGPIAGFRERRHAEAFAEVSKLLDDLSPLDLHEEYWVTEG